MDNIRHTLRDTAISTEQALRLLDMIHDDRTNVAVELYSHVCDPEDWYRIYTLGDKRGLDLSWIANATRMIEPKGEDYNYIHHPDWYHKDYRRGNRHNWDKNYRLPEGHNQGKIARLEAEVDRLKAENDRQRLEIDRLNSIKGNNRFNEQESYKRGFDDGYNKARSEMGPRPALAPMPAPACNPMTHDSFRTFRASMKNTSSRKEAINLIKTVARTNRFTTDQVTQLINDTIAKDVQEEIAIVAYDRICDPENWYRVYSALTYNASRDEVNRRLGLK